MTGLDLVAFVDYGLFPYLAGFKSKTENPQTIEYKIGEIFSEPKNKCWVPDLREKASSKFAFGFDLAEK